MKIDNFLPKCIHEGGEVGVSLYLFIVKNVCKNISVYIQFRLIIRCFRFRDKNLHFDRDFLLFELNIFFLF